jgi:glycine/D-amino acid oxidase-like deaminating enzyme
MGMRPATPDSRPIVGWSSIRNLYLNTGHGALGWTLACGSARLAGEMIARDVPSVKPGWFALSRTAIWREAQRLPLGCWHYESHDQSTHSRRPFIG